MKYFKVF